MVNSCNTFKLHVFKTASIIINFYSSYGIETTFAKLLQRDLWLWVMNIAFIDSVLCIYGYNLYPYTIYNKNNEQAHLNNSVQEVKI